jgi:hypothetical protein
MNLAAQGEGQHVLDRARMKALMQREQEQFVAARPRSQALFERARRSLLGGGAHELDGEMAGKLSRVRG